MNIVIVGRPNVGKSSLFNRLLGRKRSLVLDVAGVTRDRIVEPLTWWVNGKEYKFNLIDTGGLGPGNFEKEIENQVKTALEEASMVLMVMDIRDGLTNADQDVYKQLRHSGVTEKVPCIGILNKADSDRLEEEMHQFFEMGLDQLIPISAEHNLGIEDLKDALVEYDCLKKLARIPKPVEEPFEVEKKAKKGKKQGKRGIEGALFEDEPSGDEGDEKKTHKSLDQAEAVMREANPEGEFDTDFDESMLSDDGAEILPYEIVESPIKPLPRPLDEPSKGKGYAKEAAPLRIPRIAIVGQPNVGKSTLLNAISGETRSIVSNIAGTTVDAIDTQINWHGKEMTLIDTAGIRRKNKTEQGIEVLSVVQTKKALERADIALLMMDAEKGVYDQDEKIAGLIEELGCSVILVLNKWDLQQQNAEFSQKSAEEMLRKQIRFLGYAPLIFTTAKDGTGLDRLFRMIMYVLEQRWVKVSTRDLTDFFKTESEIHNPNNAKFYMTHQTGKNPPTFVSHVNDPKKIHFSLSRHMVKAIRARWGFLGTPIRITFAKTKNTGER